MIYDNSISFISGASAESYKERNFYFKIFGGYIFNELIPNYSERKKAFFELIIKKVKNKENCYGQENISSDELVRIVESFISDDIHVTFDFHGTQFEAWEGDRGELADILMIGKTHFISIEVKYRTNWKVLKDISLTQNRIIYAYKNTGMHGIQILLVTQDKLDNVSKKIHQSKSQMRALKDESMYLGVPLIIITWEEIRDLIKSDGHDLEVFINQQLKLT